MKLNGFKIGFILTLATSFCNGQNPGYRNAISLELTTIGKNMPGSLLLKYDYSFKFAESGFWSTNIGVGGFYGSAWNGLAVRPGLSYNFGRKNRFLEMGITGSYVNEYYDNYSPPRNIYWNIGPQIGYRSVSSKGIQFRVYTGISVGTTTFSTGGISIGWAFARSK